MDPRNAPLRKFRTYVGRRTVKNKLKKLIRSFPFMPIKDYLDKYLDSEAVDNHEKR